MLVCFHPCLLFWVPLAGRGKNYHFQMEKIALILIYNIRVTTFFFLEWKYFDCMFLVYQVRSWQTNIFLSLALSELDIVLRNVRWSFHGMILFRMVVPHTYHAWLKVVAKTAAKHLYQSLAINIEILKYQ